MSSWTLLTAIGGALGVGTFAVAEVVLHRYDEPVVWDSVRAGGADTDAIKPPEAQPTSSVVLWTWPLAGGILGLFMGTSQWLLLRRRLRGAGWWIPGNAVAWSAASMWVGRALSAILSGLGEVTIGAWDLIPAVAGGGALMGGISGGVLVGLLSRPARAPGMD